MFSFSFLHLFLHFENECKNNVLPHEIESNTIEKKIPFEIGYFDMWLNWILWSFRLMQRKTQEIFNIYEPKLWTNSRNSIHLPIYRNSSAFLMYVHFVHTISNLLQKLHINSGSYFENFPMFRCFSVSNSRTSFLAHWKLESFWRNFNKTILGGNVGVSAVSA